MPLALRSNHLTGNQNPLPQTRSHAPVEISPTPPGSSEIHSSSNGEVDDADTQRNESDPGDGDGEGTEEDQASDEWFSSQNSCKSAPSCMRRTRRVIG